MAKQVANNIFLPLPGGEQATYTASTIRFRHYDWLGSARFESNMSEQEYGDVAYAPFGEAYAVKNTPYLSFTGEQQDTVAGLSDFLYREYNPVQGRWISPDRAGLAAVDPRNPQSWNRYSYVLNNPLSATDPLGLFCVWDNGAYDSKDDPDTGSKDACENDYGGTWVEGDPSQVYDSNNNQVFGPGDWSDSPNAEGAALAQLFNPSGTGDFGDPSGMPDASVSAIISPVAPSSGPNPCSVSGRAQMLGSGLLNLALAAGKFTAAAGVEAGTSGVGTALAYYGVYSGAGNLTTGLIQTIGAFSSMPSQFQQAANVSSTVGSMAGLTILVVTNGNLSSASNAAKWENLGLFGLKGGMGSSFNPVSATGTALNGAKLAGAHIGC